MQNSCISTKSFEKTRTIYTKSEPLEIFMGSHTKDVIDKLFNTLLQRFQNAQETSNERGSEFIPDSVELLYYHFQRKDIRRAESYIISPDWIARTKATINPKNEKDNECFKWSIISGLNYKINDNYLKKIEKLKRVDTDLSSHQRDWGKFEEENNSIALNVLFVSYNSEEIKLAYKSNYNERKNQVILLMINDNEANNCYYFAVKNLSEINSLGWLKGKKEAIINNDNSFQNALNYQNIKTNPERISKLKPYIREGVDFPAGPRDWIKFEQNKKTIALNILFIPYNTKTIRVAYRSEHNNKFKKQVILLMITDGKK